VKITRHGIVERPNTLPHISGAVVHGDTVYLQGVRHLIPGATLLHATVTRTDGSGYEDPLESRCYRGQPSASTGQASGQIGKGAGAL